MTALGVLALAGVLILAWDSWLDLKRESRKRRDLRRLKQLERGRAQQAAEHRPSGTVRT